MQHPGEVIQLTDVAGIFGSAYSATARIKLAENAFKTTGIEPFDPDVINDDLFARSLETDQPRDAPTNQPNMAADENENAEMFPPPIEENPLFQQDEEVVPGTPGQLLQQKVSIQIILPLPKAKGRDTKAKRTAQKSEVGTSSPFNTILEEK